MPAFTSFDDQLPTEPGWYFLKRGKQITLFYVYRIAGNTGLCVAMMPGASGMFPIIQLQGQWLRIPPAALDRLLSDLQRQP